MHVHVHVCAYDVKIFNLCVCVGLWAFVHVKILNTLSQAFLGAVFDTLLYQLTDSLQRLGNVKKIEVTKEDSKFHVKDSNLHFSSLDHPIHFSRIHISIHCHVNVEDQWNRLDVRERAEKEAFIVGEKSVIRGYMKMV